MKRLAELDALRGLAAIAIVAFHFSEPSPLYDRFFYIGVISLELFFVLSGYLISSIILSHAEEPGFLRTFYIRRGLRIWPIYYLVVIAYAILVALRPDLGTIEALPYYLTFTQNISHYWYRQPLELAYPLLPTWSLAVEEQFYIVWPLLIGLFGTRRMLAIALSCIGLSIVSRLIGFSDSTLLSRCDGFALGGLLAVILAKSTPANRTTIALATVGGVCFLYLTVGSAWLGDRPFDMIDSPYLKLNRTVIAIFFMCLVGLVVTFQGHPCLAPLRLRGLCYLGLISYGIYLYHLTALVIGHGIVNRFKLPPMLSPAFIAPVLTLAISAGSWAWIEKPCLRWKNRFGYGGPTIQSETPVLAGSVEDAGTAPGV